MLVSMGLCGGCRALIVSVMHMLDFFSSSKIDLDRPAKTSDLLQSDSMIYDLTFYIKSDFVWPFCLLWGGIRHHLCINEPNEDRATCLQ